MKARNEAREKRWAGRRSELPISPRLRRRLGALFLISMILLVSVLYQVGVHHVGVGIACAAVLGGALLGQSLGRTHQYIWDEEARQVVGRMDWLGAVILIFYILLAINRRRLLGHWLHEEALTAVSLAVAGGTIFGRSLAARRGIRSALRRIGIVETAQPQS